MPSVFEMSDSDIMNMTAPPAPESQTPAATGAEDIQNGQSQEEIDAAAQAQADADAEAARLAQEEQDEAARIAAEQAAKEEEANKAKEGQTTTDTTEGGDNGANGGTVATTGGEQAGKTGEVKDNGSAGTQEKPEAKTDTDQVQTPDYKTLHESVMAPLKANGKTVEIKSPEDLRQLAQMGLNYTQKMQAIAPLRKVGLMLQDHGLLDESKLSYLIDLHNKKPEAIRQLIKDAGIDPLEIDTSADTGYTPGNHAISDVESSFRTKVADFKSSAEGQATIDMIHNSWDDASKQQLFTNPDVLDIIHEHRASGVYAKVAGEVDRLIALGQVPQGVSYLQAYQAVGNDMGKQGLLEEFVAKPQAQAQPVQKQPIATQVQQKKPDANAAKIAAATQTASTAKKAEVKHNPLDLSDEAFEAELKRVRGY